MGRGLEGYEISHVHFADDTSVFLKLTKSR